MQRATTAPGKLSASERVVQAVAARTGVDPLDLEVPLYESIDPDVLDLVVRTAPGGPDRSSVRVEFTYEGLDVTVTADGSIDVLERR